MYVIYLSLPYYLSNSQTHRPWTVQKLILCVCLYCSRVNATQSTDSILMLASNWWLSPLPVTSNLLTHTLVRSALILFKNSDSVSHSVLWCRDPKLYFPKVTESLSEQCCLLCGHFDECACALLRNPRYDLHSDQEVRCCRRWTLEQPPYCRHGGWLTVFTRSTVVHHVPVS